MTSGRKAKEQMRDNDKVVVVKGAAPKSGTELTRERMSENLRSLNSSWTKKGDKRQTDSTD